MLRVVELFAGVGSQTQALKNIGVEHEVVGIAEIDKHAISSYIQLHGDTPLLGDISKIDSLPNADLWTYSFPCQDLSVAGKGAGIKEGTRSGLLFEVERLLEVSEKPKYLLMENVKNLVGKKNKPDFDRWCQKLEELGYKNYWQVLNAKDYGVPQNRERVFMVSILDNGEYKFPEKEVLNIRLKDIMEDTVEEKYYLKSTKALQLVKDLSSRFEIGKKECCDMSLKNPKIREISNCIIARYDSGVTNNQAEGIAVIEPFICASRGRNPNNPSDRTAGSPTEQRLEPNLQCVSNALTTVQKDNLVFLGGVGNPNRIVGGKGLSREYKEGYRVYSVDGIASTQKANGGGLGGCTGLYSESPNYRIRKLTPKECWRLMGWKDEQFDKIKGISNSQLYKQAGNGIVVNVLERIFENLFKGE